MTVALTSLSTPPHPPTPAIAAHKRHPVPSSPAPNPNVSASHLGATSAATPTAPPAIPVAHPVSARTANSRVPALSHEHVPPPPSHNAIHLSTSSSSPTTTATAPSVPAPGATVAAAVPSAPPVAPSVSTTRQTLTLRRVLRSPRLYRTLVVLCLSATLVFAIAQIPLRTLHFIVSSFVPRLSPSGLSSQLHPWRRYVRTLVHSYQRQLHVRPLFSRAVTAGFIFFIADLTAQLLARPRHKAFHTVFSPMRLTRYWTYGLFFMGPLLYVWYDTMNRLGPPDDLQGSVLKSVFEQITLEPICISAYLIYDGLCARKPYRAISHTLRTRFWPLWFNNSMFWVPANFANYYVGTPDMRVVFSNLCSLFWNVYFSAKVNGFVSVPQQASQQQKHGAVDDTSAGLPLTSKDATVVPVEAVNQQPGSSTTRVRRATGNVAATMISLSSLPRSPPTRSGSDKSNGAHGDSSIHPHTQSLSGSVGPRARSTHNSQQPQQHHQQQQAFDLARQQLPFHSHSDRSSLPNSQMEQNHLHAKPSTSPPPLPRLVTSTSLRP